ncbi:hypothetical protein D9M71_803860 [compost metagenome]
MVDAHESIGVMFFCCAAVAIEKTKAVNSIISFMLFIFFSIAGKKKLLKKNRYVQEGLFMSEKDIFFRFCSVFDEKIENKNEDEA